MARLSVGRVIAETRYWFADTVRLYFGLGYWNLRKSWFLLTGRRARNPCQNPGDGDAPGTIRCDACVTWDRPARFRRVCPLLVQRDKEWRCAAGRNAVRTYWGRTLGWYAGAVLAVYLMGTFLAFGFLRITSAPTVTWWQVAWPAQWEQIPRAQAQRFLYQAARAFATGRPAEALLALSSARQLDPGQYQSRLLQAQIAMYQLNLAHADAEFAAMLGDYPDEFERTAITYHDTLLALFRAEKLAHHCLAMAQRDGPRTAIWVRSLLHALRMAGAAERFLAEEAAGVQNLPEHARLLLAAEEAWQRGDPAAARARLARPFPGPLNLFYMQTQVALLARMGGADEAGVLLHHYGMAMGEFEYLLARLDIDFLTPGGWGPELDFRNLLNRPLTPAQAERIAVLLITHPESEYYLRLHRHLLDRPELAAGVSGAALWVAGLLCGAAEPAAHWREAGRRQPGDVFPAITRIDLTSRRLDASDGVPALINTLTLPREVIFALQARLLTVAAQSGRGDR